MSQRRRPLSALAEFLFLQTLLLAALKGCSAQAPAAGNFTCGPAAKSELSDYTTRLSEEEKATLAASPLHNATAYWNVPEVQLLLEKEQVDPNIRSSAGATPLHTLLDTSSAPYWHPYTHYIYIIACLLLSHGADPNIPYPGEYHGTGVYNYTPLEYVSYDGQYSLVSMMLKAGANVNATDSRGNTALMQAAKCDFRLSSDTGAADTAVLLLDAGANPLARNKLGNTSFDFTPGKARSPDDVDCAGKVCKDCAKYSDQSDCPRMCKVLQSAQAGDHSKPELSAAARSWADMQLGPKGTTCCK